MCSALLLVPREQQLEVVGRVLREDLHALHLATERRALAHPAAQVDQERVRPRPVHPRLQRRHQADVGHLEPRARVGAAVHVDPDLLVEPRQPRGELLGQPHRAALRLADRELAELDAGARHRPLAERVRTRAQVQVVEARDQLVGACGVHPADHELLLRGRGELSVAERVGEVGHDAQLVPRDASCPRREPDEHAPVPLLVHADVVALGQRSRRGSRAVGQRDAVQELSLQHLADVLGSPVLDQELQPRVVPGATVAVLAEEPRHAGPHLRHARRLDERAEPLREHRVRGEAAADLQVVAGPERRMVDADERDVVDLGVRAVHAATADRRLVLARQVGERRIAQVARRDRADVGGRVQHLVGRDAGERAAEEHARRVAARLLRREPDGVDPLEDRGHVLDADPVQLHVLPVGDVGDVAPEPLARPRDRAQLLARHAAAVDPDPHHEELVLELLGLGRAGALAGHALLALRVEAVPPQARTQVLLADRAEPARREDPVDPLADVQAVVVLLDLLGGVERLVVAQPPLPLASFAGCRSWGGRVAHRVTFGRGNGKGRLSAASAVGTEEGVTAASRGCRLPGHRAAPCDSTGDRASWQRRVRRCGCGS